MNHSSATLCATTIPLSEISPTSKLQNFKTSKLQNFKTSKLQNFKTSKLRRRPHRPSLNKLRFDRRLAGVFFSLADVTDPAHDAVRHRTAAPADMRDRWTALAEMRVVIDADQGIDPRRRTGPEPDLN
jgi:hypothetical protein